MTLYTLNFDNMQPVSEADGDVWADWMDSPDRLLLLSEGHTASQICRLETFFIGFDVRTIPGGPYFFGTQYTTGSTSEALKIQVYPRLSRTYDAACMTHRKFLAELKAGHMPRQTSARP